MPSQDPIPAGAIPMGHNFGSLFVPFGRFPTYVTRGLIEVNLLAAWYWRDGEEITFSPGHREA